MPPSIHRPLRPETGCPSTIAETYTYDALNRLRKKTYPDSSTFAYAYDNDSHLIQVVDPTGNYTTRRNY